MSKENLKRHIPLSEPEISGNEWQYIKECLDTGWVSSVGNFVNRFEETVADYIGTKYAVALVNGTSALHISLLACGIMPNDEVIVPALTFIAPANVVKYCHAFPVFMDCHEDTLCIDTAKVIDFIKNKCRQGKDGYTYNKTTKRKVGAIIPVHIFGHPTDMDELIKICKKNNIHIIEDATESLGSEYKGRKTGSLGTIGCLSFNGNKIITTGGGGMVVTSNKVLAEKIRHLSTQAKKDPFEYDHDAVGYNYRLSNLQAAIGVAQMERIDRFILIKRKNAQIYKRLLSGIQEVRLLWEKPWARSNFWLNTVQVPSRHKKSLMEFLLSKGIQVRPIWKLIHKLPMYADCQTFDVEKAEGAYRTCVNIPSSIGVKEEEIGYIANNIVRYFKG